MNNRRKAALAKARGRIIKHKPMSPEHRRAHRRAKRLRAALWYARRPTLIIGKHQRDWLGVGVDPTLRVMSDRVHNIGPAKFMAMRIARNASASGERVAILYPGFCYPQLVKARRIKNVKPIKPIFDA